MVQRLVTTAGHVDHGKSTLVRALTGYEPDRWEEERARGLTIDLGFEWTTRSRVRAGVIGAAARDAMRAWDDVDDVVFFVDVPGHERFVDNLLTAMIDARFVLLVVSGVEGWSNGTQLHVDVLDALGVDHGIVAISRADDPAATPVDELSEQVGEWLAGTSLAGSRVVAVDSVTERGLPELAEALFAGLSGVPDARPGRARLWIDRAFSIRGSGTVVTGRLEGAPIHVGDTVRVAPRGHTSTVRALHVADRPVERAEPESRVAVNLRGVAPSDVLRGSALLGRVVSEREPPTIDVVLTTDVRARLTVSSPSGVASRGAWTMHAGTAKVAARVVTDGSARAAQGTVVDLRVRLASPLPLRVGDRFLLWDAGRGVVGGGGVVLDAAPSGVRRRVVASERARLLAAIEPDGDRSAVAAALVDASGGRRAWSEVAWLADVEEVPPTIAMVGDWAVSASTWAQLRTVAVDTVAQRTPANRDEVADALVGAVPGLPADVALRAIDRLIDGNLLARIGTELVLPEHADATVAERRRRKSALVAALEESGLDPPPLAALRREHGLTAPEVDELARARELVVSGDVGFSRAQFEGAVARLVDAFGDGWFTVSEARQVLGVPRRATLALLAATDRGRVTEMRDDAARRVATTSGGGGALRSPRATRS